MMDSPSGVGDPAIPMQPGDQPDGCTNLRPIARGGYVEVWLCRADSVGDLRTH